jgi:hypothetical protein
MKVMNVLIFVSVVAFVVIAGCTGTQELVAAPGYNIVTPVPEVTAIPTQQVIVVYVQSVPQPRADNRYVNISGDCVLSQNGVCLPGEIPLLNRKEIHYL